MRELQSDSNFSPASGRPRYDNTARPRSVRPRSIRAASSAPIVPSLKPATIARYSRAVSSENPNVRTTSTTAASGIARATTVRPTVDGFDNRTRSNGAPEKSRLPANRFAEIATPIDSARLLRARKRKRVSRDLSQEYLCLGTARSHLRRYRARHRRLRPITRLDGRLCEYRRGSRASGYGPRRMVPDLCRRRTPFAWRRFREPILTGAR